MTDYQRVWAWGDQPETLLHHKLSPRCEWEDLKWWKGPGSEKLYWMVLFDLFFAWLERLIQHPGFWVTGSEVASSDFLLWLLGTWASVAHTVASKLSSLAAPRAGPPHCRTVQMTSGHGNAMSLAQLACGWLPVRSVRYYAWQNQELLEIWSHLETKATFLFVDFVDGCSLMLFMCQLRSFMPGIVSCSLIF